MQVRRRPAIQLSVMLPKGTAAFGSHRGAGGTGERLLEGRELAEAADNAELVWRVGVGEDA